MPLSQIVQCFIIGRLSLIVKLLTLKYPFIFLLIDTIKVVILVLLRYLRLKYIKVCYAS